MNKHSKTSSEPQRIDEDRWLEVVRQHVDSLRFGVVQIVVHDSRVTQIERTERVRFDKHPLEKL
ncbi:MAG: YezD family protein [Verrucomicrobia bacterium]|nr:YezD family protein [Verrucomicrobiota bacterium]